MKRLRGIIPPLVTPLRDSNSLDRAALRRLIDHVLGGGVHGVFVLGTGGEGPSLGHRVRSTVIEQSCQYVNGRVPVVVGVTDTAPIESLRFARKAARAGADAVAIAPPFYFDIGQHELASYYAWLVPQMPLPVLLYNMPGLTGIRFELDTVSDLSRLSGICGIKDSSGDLDYFQALLELRDRRRPDWSVLVGNDLLAFEAVACGGDGAVAGGANLIPELFVQGVEVVHNGDRLRRHELEKCVATLQGVFRVSEASPATAVVQGMKSVLCSMGICRDTLARPLQSLTEDEHEQVRHVLRSVDHRFGAGDWTVKTRSGSGPSGGMMPIG